MNVEVNGKTYCVETLIADNERLRKEIIESAKTNRLVIEGIKAEIDEIPLSEPMVSADGLYCYGSMSITIGHFREKVFEVIDKYIGKGANE